MRPLASVLLLAAALCGQVTLSQLSAAEAAFTEDGKTLIACPNQGAKLWSVSLADGKTTVLDLGKQLKGEDIQSISRGPEGQFWIATSKKLFLWKPGGDTTKEVLTLEHGEFTEINWNPSTGDLLAETFGGELETDSNFYVNALPKGASEMMQAKDAPTIFSAAYDSEGRLFFCGEGDLWAGLATTDDDVGLTLSVWRAAPLAILQYDAGNPGSSFSLMDVTPAGKSLVMTFSNEVEAFLIQMPKPNVPLDLASPLEKLPVGVPASWKQAATVLQSLKVIPMKGSFATLFNLCSSPDESQVFFLAHSDDDGDRTFRLLDVKTGKIKVLGEAPDEDGESEEPKAKAN